jgi:hypothetical protein
LLNDPIFLYDYKHSNDKGFNKNYTNENFIDIIMNSYKKEFSKLLLEKIHNGIINYNKRNILISWLTEIIFKFTLDESILFFTVKLLDKFIYNNTINLKYFQLVGTILYNISLKNEKIYSSLNVEEIKLLIGDKDIKNSEIIQLENTILRQLDYTFNNSTSYLILQRLLQIMNYEIKDLYMVSTFILELSLYNEKFNEFTDFVKALSSIVISKKILNKFYKIEIHEYLKLCINHYQKEIRSFYYYIIQTIKLLKSYKYGNTIFIKYQDTYYDNIFNKYLLLFLKEGIS